MDYKRIASEVIDAVGGKDNIVSCMHCATRLRLTLKNWDLIDDDAVASVEAVKGTFLAKGQYQIIFGAGTVNMVCDEATAILGINAEAAPSTENEDEGNWLQKAVKTLSDIFVPIIPAIVAGGLLMGINNVLTAPGLFAAGKSFIDLNPGIADLATVINMFANAAFTFLPVLIGFSATKKFGGNPYLGAAMGMIMVHPDLMNAYSYGKVADVPTWNLFGLAVEAVGYQGTVLPVLGVSWILANIEKKLHKITPSWLDNLTTPLIATVVTGFITFIVVGPVLRMAGIYLADGITWMYNSLGFIGGGLFGCFYAPIVLTGMHHSFIAVETQLLASIAATGGTFIFTTASMSNVAQGAATLGVLATTKDEKLKSLCTAGGISALLGITEPAMFGVTLKLKYPFIASCIGAGVGSAYLAATHVLASALGAAGIPGFLSINPEHWLNFLIGIILSMAVSFAVTVVLAKKENAKKAVETVVVTTEKNTVYCPMNGEIKPLSEASDKMFASKSMGDGVVIIPSDGTVYAPFNGTVTMIFPSKHAIGLTSEDGIELLIHCGMDTVELNGKHFETFVNVNDAIKAGQPLLRMDLKEIAKAGYSTETPCVITNGKAFDLISTGSAKTGNEVMKIHD